MRRVEPTRREFDRYPTNGGVRSGGPDPIFYFSGFGSSVSLFGIGLVNAGSLGGVGWPITGAAAGATAGATTAGARAAAGVTAIQPVAGSSGTSSSATMLMI